MKKNTLTILAAIFMATTMFAQTVTTFTEGTPDDGIAIDSNGNIYSSNYVGDSVFKFTPSGDVTTFITGLNSPNGLAFNSNEELYVCDGQANTIYKYDINGVLLDSYPVSNHPSGIIKDFFSEDMILTQFQGNTIKRLAPDGTVTDVSIAPELNGPVGLAYDEAGNLYVGNYINREIYKISLDGSADYIATVPGDGGNRNLGFIAYGQGRLWGTVLQDHKIYTINPNSIDETLLFAGSLGGITDGDISEATFNQPNGILFNDAEDILYVTDFGSKNLRIISGIVLSNGDLGLKKSDFQLYPNPSIDFVTLQFNASEKYSIRVLDVLGKEILQLKGDSFQEKIIETLDVSSWSKGTYFVEVRSENYSETKKLIK